MNNYYVLATVNNHGTISYWTGDWTARKLPVVNVNKDEAKTFKTAAAANFAGVLSKKLELFRAIRLPYKPSLDGFKNFWWIPEEDDEDGYE